MRPKITTDRSEAMMSDRYPAEIRIGGQLSRTADSVADPEESVLNVLVSMINDAKVSHEYGDATAVISVDCLENEKSLFFYSDESGQWLQFRDDQAVNGEFADLEDFLIENRISFDRRSSHYCEYDAENVYFRRSRIGLDTLETTHVDSNGNEVICGETVRQALEKLDKYEQVAGKATAFQVEDWENFAAGLRLLREACPEIPGPLPKFEIVD